MEAIHPKFKTDFTGVGGQVMKLVSCRGNLVLGKHKRATGRRRSAMRGDDGLKERLGTSWRFYFGNSQTTHKKNAKLDNIN